MIPVFFVAAYHLWPMPAIASGDCGRPAEPLWAVQSVSGPSPSEGERVTVEAVVTADFTGEDAFGGFYLQMPDDVGPDIDALRGLFVYAPGENVVAGQRLRLNGRVTEYRGTTQLSRIRIEAVCGEGENIQPRSVGLPLNDRKRHRLRGMLVELEAPAVITGLWPLARYGVIKVADERLYRPTQVVSPGHEARARARENERRMLRLDDGSRRQYPEPIPWPPGGLPEHPLRVGDHVHDVVGVLEHRYGNWRLQPVVEPRFESVNKRPESLPPPSEGELRIASFNVENYFIGDGEGGGFPTERGARSVEEFERQEAKLINAIKGLNADILGLIEIENNGFGEDSAIARLARQSEGNWRVVRPESDRLGSDAIKVGLIYNADRVETVGLARTIEEEPFAWGNRQPLAQRFRHVGGGESFRVVVNHFKSKICGRAEGGNADQGDGQSCWNAHRLEASEVLTHWVGKLAQETGNDRTLLVGDFNAYAREDPVRRLEEAGFHNSVAWRDSAAVPHSFVYRGESGTLDYIFAWDTLNASIQDAGVWAINADEPPVLGYSGGNARAAQRQGLFAPQPWRSSDHDPAWVTLEVMDASDSN